MLKSEASDAFLDRFVGVKFRVLRPLLQLRERHVLDSQLAFPAWGAMHVEHGFDEVFEDSELATLQGLALPLRECDDPPYQPNKDRDGDDCGKMVYGVCGEPTCVCDGFN